MPHPDLLPPELLPWQQAINDPYLCRRHSNTQRQVWLSLCRFSCYAQGLAWALWSSLVGMQSDSKCDLIIPTILLGLLLCPWKSVSFINGLQHSPVNGCSAKTCNFGVLAGEDECMSFYSIILSGIINQPFNMTVIQVSAWTTNTE